MSQEQQKTAWVYECPWKGEKIEPDDKRLIGLGNPPRSPNEPPGMGGVAMRPVPRTTIPPKQ